LNRKLAPPSVTNKKPKESSEGPIRADRALFIKLGEGGRWEAECLNNGTLRFGYQEIPHAVCEQARISGDWSAVETASRSFSKDKGSATRHVNQVREFYEAGDDVLWITFYSDRLWWCFSKREVEGLSDDGKSRRVTKAWSDEDINGQPLLKGQLSGRLLTVQGFQGTICSVSELGYLLHKINGTAEPHVAAAQTAFENLQSALIPIIKGLHHKDLEILIDLIFRQSGWQRVGVSGETEKDIDLDLISPVTDERVAVQVKSKASAFAWRSYREKYADMRGYTRFYFVTHSPTAALLQEAAAADDPGFILWDAQKIAWHSVRGGLTGWLLDKAS
jgi:hypothetical protein